MKNLLLKLLDIFSYIFVILCVICLIWSFSAQDKICLEVFKVEGEEKIRVIRVFVPLEKDFIFVGKGDFQGNFNNFESLGQYLKYYQKENGKAEAKLMDAKIKEACNWYGKKSPGN